MCSALIFFAWLQVVGAGISQAQPGFILDTDLSSDVDDAGAVAVLHGLADQGEARILAMMVSSGDPWSAPYLDALNTWYGRPDIPIGEIKHGAVKHESKYTRTIAERYPHDLDDTAAIPDSTALYRQILASQPDHSVTVVSIGYLTNLARLLDSPPDTYSPLTGLDLVRSKVRRLVCMGGRFPSGREWNIYQDAASAIRVIDDWPTPIIFCGFEIGQKILTGAGLKRLPQEHPLRLSYQLYNGLADRQSWDQAAVVIAVDADLSSQGYWTLSSPGRAIVGPDGVNRWHSSLNGSHRFVFWTGKTSELDDIIEALMVQGARTGSDDQ